MAVMNALNSDRLLIDPLTTEDNLFIADLLNTEGWLTFIGNRNVSTPDKAIVYIQKILDNPAINYWVVRLKNDRTSIGIITFIKRDYLPYHDIGFAFLPAFTGQGYAYETTKSVLATMADHSQPFHILATTIRENTRSIRLLNKLGFYFERQIEVDNQKLDVFGTSISTLLNYRDLP